MAQSGEPVVSTVHFQHNVACLSVCHLLYLSYSIYLSLLSVCLFVSLPLCLSIHHLFIYLSFYHFIYLSTCLFAYLPLCAYFSLSHSIYLSYLSPSIHLSLPSAYLPTSNYMCTYFSLCLFYLFDCLLLYLSIICSSTCLSIHLSVYLKLWTVYKMYLPFL